MPKKILVFGGWGGITFFAQSALKSS